MGNVTAALAALAYLLPLQLLLHDRKGKRDDVGTFFAALVILLAMWALLLASLLLAVAAGALDVLALPRVFEGALGAAGLVAMAVVSSLFFEPVPRGNRLAGTVFAASLHVFPLLTLALVLVFLNPGLANPTVAGWLQFAWIGLAGACLAVCAPVALVLLVRALWRRARTFTQRLLGGRGRSATYLQELADLDPVQDFSRLVGLTNAYYGGVVRDAAAARLRAAAGMVALFTRELEAGSAENALFALARIALTREEQAALAGPACAAIHRLAAECRADGRPMSTFHRMGARLAAGHMLRGVEGRFPAAENEFARARTALLQALTQQGKPAS